MEQKTDYGIQSSDYITIEVNNSGSAVLHYYVSEYNGSAVIHCQSAVLQP